MQARRTGRGCDVDTCLFDVAMHQLAYSAVWYLNEGDKAERLPRSAHLSQVPVQTFPTADGWIFVMCMTEKFWRIFCDVIGRPDLPQDQRSQPRKGVAQPRCADCAARPGAAHRYHRTLAGVADGQGARRPGLRPRPGARCVFHRAQRHGAQHLASGPAGAARAGQSFEDRRRAVGAAGLRAARRR